MRVSLNGCSVRCILDYVWNESAMATTQVIGGSQEYQNLENAPLPVKTLTPS